MSLKGYLVEGQHTLAIEYVAQQAGRSDRGLYLLFIIEGRVLKSTALNFAGSTFSYVCAIGNNNPTIAHQKMKEIAAASKDPAVMATAADADDHIFNRISDDTSRSVDGAVIFADTRTVKSRRGTDVITTRFSSSDSPRVPAPPRKAPVEPTTLALYARDFDLDTEGGS